MSSSAANLDGDTNVLLLSASVSASMAEACAK